jgi:hypothetical protein
MSDRYEGSHRLVTMKEVVKSERIKYQKEEITGLVGQKKKG